GDVGGRELVELRNRLNAFAGGVHEGLRLQDQHALAGDAGFAEQAFELLAEGRETVAFGDFLDGEEADIVPVLCVFVPGIAEADDQMHRLPPGEMRRERAAEAAPSEAYFLAGWLPAGAAPLAGAAAPAAGAAAPAAGAAAAASSDLRADGAAMVAMVRSVSWVRTEAPLGSSIDDRWIGSPMSLPVRSTVSDSGMESAGTCSSRVWCTMLSTPPFLMPGLCSWLTKWTATWTLSLVCAPTRRKSTCIALSLTTSS